MQHSKAVVEKHSNGLDVSHQSAGHALKATWPTGGTRLASGVQPPGFLPVTEEILAEIVRHLVAALDPEKIILFGSYAYGAPSGGSDVDVLVIMQTTASPADRYVSVSRVIRPRPFPLDLLVKTPDEIARALANGDSFIQEIITQGCALFARLDRSAHQSMGGLLTKGVVSHEHPLRCRKTACRHDPSREGSTAPMGRAGSGRCFPRYYQHPRSLWWRTLYCPQRRP
jgi:uncharacterized protein